MTTIEGLLEGKTLAEAQGMTAELGGAIVRMAAEEVRRGRLDSAREILEGMAVTNPRDPATWCLLAQVLRRQGHLAGGRFCAEVAVRLAPENEQVRLARAEVLLGYSEDVSAAREELRTLASRGGKVGVRARALLTALGNPPQPA
jgi:cytochrome c-type biogenesis protein CcmH/NrfG